eukprot:7920534-Pyramimonas_sp.AAC.1
MSCPWERGTCSNVCAIFRPMMLMLLPMSRRVVSIPPTMVPLFAARASSWRSPNIPGTSTVSYHAYPCGASAPTPNRSLSEA